MTTITLSPDRPRKNNPPIPVAGRRRRGFTLVEVMIGATISSFILAAVLSSFLFLARSGANIGHYNDMESQARRSLELFAQDIRQASAIIWTSAESVTVNVDTVLVTYTFNPGAVDKAGNLLPDTGFFTRQTVAEANPRTLLTGIRAFSFKAYTISGAEIVGIGKTVTLAAAGQTTKQLQISLQASRKSQTVMAATNTVLSARFILRNKRVTA